MNLEISRILDAQTSWARRRGLEIGDSRHASDLEANLFRPLSEPSRRELEQSASHPLGDVRLRAEADKPCDLQLLESTLALVCNVFEPGRERPGALAAACGGDALTEKMCFCARVPAGTSALTSELTLLFDTDLDPGSRVGRPTAITASYAEPYRSARPRREPANRISSRWLEASGVWEGLPMCRRLALDLRATPRRFEHVSAAELLEAGAALTTRYGYRGFRLVHVWYDTGGTAAAKYRGELDRFRFRTGGELDFRTLTWQQLLARLTAHAGDAAQPVDETHLRYVQDRYALARCHPDTLP